MITGAVTREKRLIGYDPDSKQLDTEVLRKHLFGGHVADYMRHLQEEDEEQYQKQFSKYIKANIGPDEVKTIIKLIMIIIVLVTYR